MAWNFNLLSEALVGQQQKREGEIITLLFKITRKTKTFRYCLGFVIIINICRLNLVKIWISQYTDLMWPHLTSPDLTWPHVTLGEIRWDPALTHPTLTHPHPNLTHPDTPPSPPWPSPTKPNPVRPNQTHPVSWPRHVIPYIWNMTVIKVRSCLLHC